MRVEIGLGTPHLDVDEAVELMLRGRGTHFDPRLLDLFLSSIDDLPGVRENYPG